MLSNYTGSQTSQSSHKKQWAIQEDITEPNTIPNQRKATKAEWNKRKRQTSRFDIGSINSVRENVNYHDQISILTNES